MAKILALDTSTDACSVALLANNQFSERFTVAPQKHTQIILSMINDILVEAKINLKHLDAIAFGSGPGSFTGIRLAASITQGLSFANNLPVIKVSTLQALAQETLVELKLPRVLVAQDARMGEVYWGKYQADSLGIMQPLQPEQVTAPKKIKIDANQNFVGVGSGFSIYQKIFADILSLPTIDKQYVQAKYILKLAALSLKDKTVIAQEALPVYLREKVAWLRENRVESNPTNLSKR